MEEFIYYFVFPFLSVTMALFIYRSYVVLDKSISNANESLKEKIKNYESGLLDNDYLYIRKDQLIKIILETQKAIDITHHTLSTLDNKGVDLLDLIDGYDNTHIHKKETHKDELIFN